MFLLVENYQIDHSVWSSDRTGIFEQTSCPKPLGCQVIRFGWALAWTWAHLLRCCQPSSAVMVFFSLLLPPMLVAFREERALCKEEWLYVSHSHKSFFAVDYVQLQSSVPLATRSTSSHQVAGNRMPITTPNVLFRCWSRLRNHAPCSP